MRLPRPQAKAVGRARKGVLGLVSDEFRAMIWSFFILHAAGNFLLPPG